MDGHIHVHVTCTCSMWETRRHVSLPVNMLQLKLHFSGINFMCVSPHRVFGMSGNIYTGQFHGGELHGQGLLRTPAGEQYEGDFIAGRREGAQCQLRDLSILHARTWICILAIMLYTCVVARYDLYDAATCTVIQVSA